MPTEGKREWRGGKGKGWGRAGGTLINEME